MHCVTVYANRPLKHILSNLVRAVQMSLPEPTLTKMVVEQKPWVSPTDFR
jgi:hypothetical protein